MSIIEKWFERLLFFPVSLTYIAIKNPIIILGLYVALLPIDQLFVMENVGALTKYLGGFAALVMLGNRVFFNHGKVMRPTSAIWLWILFFIWLFISYFWAEDQSKIIASRALVRTLELFVLYFIISLCQFNSKDIIWLKRLTILGGIGASIYLFYLILLGISWGGDNIRFSIIGIQAKMADPNSWSVTLLIPIIFSLEWLINTKNRGKKFLAVISFTIILFSIFSSGSRGIALGTGTAILIFLWGKMRKILWKSVIGLIIFIAIIIIVLYSYIPTELIDRYTYTNIIRTHGAGRFTIWKLGAVAFVNSPIYGVGYNNFKEATNRYLSQVKEGYLMEGKSPHSLYIGIAVELGIIGLILLLITLWKHWKLLRTLECNGDRSFAAIEAIFIGMLVINFTLGLLDHKSFWFALSLIPMLINLQKQ